MKNLIVILNEKTMQFDDIEDLKEVVLKDWSSLSSEQIEKRLYEESFGISKMEDLQIVHSKKGVMGDNYEFINSQIKPEKAIYIDTIELYLMSLCKFNLITILEEKENRVFTRDIGVEVKELDNYIIVNAYIDSILKMMVGDSYVS